MKQEDHLPLILVLQSISFIVNSLERWVPMFFLSQALVVRFYEFSSAQNYTKLKGVRIGQV